MRNSELKQIASDLFTGFAPQKLQKSKQTPTFFRKAKKLGDQIRKHLVYERKFL